MLRQNKKTRKLKREAHNLASIIWGDFTSFQNRVPMYRWLSLNTRTGHIGSLREKELEDLVRKLKRKLANEGSYYYKKY